MATMARLNMKCPKCGGKIGIEDIFDESRIVLDSDFVCINCGWRQLNYKGDYADELKGFKNEDRKGKVCWDKHLKL